MGIDYKIRNTIMDEKCKWTVDEDGIYDTGCGERYEFFEDGPKENKVNFCMYCGKIIEVEDNV